MTIYLNDEDVAQLLSLPAAIQCVDEAFRLLSDGTALNSPRRRATVEQASVNIMWSAVPTRGVLGIKEYLVVNQNVTQGTVLTLLLHSLDTGELLAVIKADRLGQLRTAAASAVATRELARPDSRSLAVYGCGYQAETQVLAIAAVLPDLEVINVVGRSIEHRDSFVARLGLALDMDVRAASAREAAVTADVIVTATGSATPVLDGSWVRRGTHVNAVGSNVATKRELDRALLERVGVLVVDDREVAANECGDLIANEWDQTGVVTIGDVLTRRAPGRSSIEELTLFESQGLAVQDVVCGAHIHKRAKEMDIGQWLSQESPTASQCSTAGTI